MLDNSELFRKLRIHFGELKPGECDCGRNIFCKVYRSSELCDEYEDKFKILQSNIFYIGLLVTAIISSLTIKIFVLIPITIGFVGIIHMITAYLLAKWYMSRKYQSLILHYEYEQSQIELIKIQQAQFDLERLSNSSIS